MKKACETLRSFLLISAYENQADLTNLWGEKFRKDKASGKSRILKVFRLFSFSLTVFETIIFRTLDTHPTQGSTVKRDPRPIS